MANSLMQFINGASSMPMNPQMLAQKGGMNMPQMLGQIRKFKNVFKGNPKQQVMSMVQNGMRSNDQLQQAMQMAQQFKGMF